MRPHWSRLFRLETIDPEWDKIPSTPGIYVVMSQKSIPRIGGIDRKGILYVGKAFYLRDRLNKFWSADHIASYFLLMNPQVAHIVLRKKVSSEDDLYPLLGNLYTSIATPIKGRESLDRAERAVLFSYLNHFGELPPLNFSMRARWKDRPSKEDTYWAEKVIK